MQHAFPLKGIVPPLATPLTEELSLDVESLERLIEHVLAGGVHGIFVLGTTGEGPSLPERVQRELIDESSRIIAGRVPLLVGITDTAAEKSLELAEWSAQHSADAVVLAGPPYFPINQEELAGFAADMIGRSPLPVFLYNMPSHTKLFFEIDTVQRLLDEPNLSGIKDSSGQMINYNRLIELCRERPDFTLLMGPEELLAESVLMGGHGGVCGGANLYPSLYVELYEAAVSGDLAAVHKLQQRVIRLSNRLYGVGPAPTGFMTGIKAALSIAGLCRNVLAPPLKPLPAERLREIEQHLHDLGLLEEMRL